MTIGLPWSLRGGWGILMQTDRLILTPKEEYPLSQYESEIRRRRTFAIISHPDAGKTTLTEKFLLYGGAIAQAGAVKGKKNSRAAVSDWMEIEKQRGISVTSSVLQFQYDGYCINILDTPGHQDFSEDTYRTLMAADSAVMVIDAAKGVEAQTRKLFKVCVLRDIPIFTFINKMDREARDPFELLEEIEKELGIETYAVNWPIGCGKEFQGVYDRGDRAILHFTAQGGAKRAVSTEISLEDPDLDNLITPKLRGQLQDDVELLDGASCEFDMERVRHGKLSPVFFGSALTNFGVEPFLERFLEMTTPPLPRNSDEGIVDSLGDDFSAFVFKIQANMNKAHRDRVAFMRVCSGRFDKEQEVYHVQGGKKIRLSQPQQIMAAEREMIDEAFAGDIIGVFDPGIFSIGDTLCMPGKSFRFDPIPTFAPEHFARVRPVDTMKRKQFLKGAEQIAQEGAIQIFRLPYSGMEEVVVGVVGTLQFEVLEYRLRSEYNVEIRRESLPYSYLRWIESPQEVTEDDLILSNDCKMVEDYHGRKLLLFSAAWSINWVLDKNKTLQLTEFGGGAWGR
ncbi:MAG: Peptide chain release factor 3 [Firmicutes bacterium]|nr:Peptide chain release factor 3 [Bacillota bacterium]